MADPFELFHAFLTTVRARIEDSAKPALPRREKLILVLALMGRSYTEIAGVSFWGLSLSS